MRQGHIGSYSQLLRGKLVEQYEKQTGHKYTSGSLFDWLAKVAPDASGYQDPIPAYQFELTEEKVVSDHVLDASGALTESYPETDELGVLSQAQMMEPARLRAAGSLHIDGFRRLMYEVLQVVQPDVLFVPAYPDWVKPTDMRVQKVFPTGEVRDTDENDQDLSNFVDTITFKVVRSMPGELDENARFSPGGRREIKPRRRETGLGHRLSTNKMTNIEGQWFSNYVQFDLFTRTNDEAEDMVEWFEEFMDLYKYVFMYAGISKMHYWMRLEDEELVRWKTGLSVRSVQYYIRTERLYEVDVNRVRQINITLLDLITTQLEHELYKYSKTQRDPMQTYRDAAERLRS